MLLQPEPLIHIPLYCWRNAPDYAMRAMVQQLLACLQSYFTHENTYALLVTTNDRRPFEIVSAYKQKTGYGFDLRLVTEDELLSVLHRSLPALRRALDQDDLFEILSNPEARRRGDRPRRFRYDVRGKDRSEAIARFPHLSRRRESIDGRRGALATDQKPNRFLPAAANSDTFVELDQLRRVLSSGAWISDYLRRGGTLPRKP